MDNAIFTPMLAMMLLTLLVWVYLFVKRVPFLQAANIPNDELTAAKLAEISPPAVINPSDNLKNLFELPVVFYALCLYLSVTNTADTTHLAAAWVFVVFRYLHSLMHCTINIVLARFGLYLISSLALWFMVLRAGMTQLTS